MRERPSTMDETRAAPKRAAARRTALLFGAIAVCRANPDLDRVVELALKRYGVHAAETVDTWRALVETNRDLPERDKLELVNDFFNARVGFAPDTRAWGATDYWATPLETLGRGMGDCEDFSIGKYVTLIPMRTGLVAASTRSTSASHSVRSGAGPSSRRIEQTSVSRPSSWSTSGIS